MAKLFISYRREDSAGVAGRLFDRLQVCFGRDFVFMDVDSIPVGVDFRKHLTSAVAECDALLAVIGDRWATASHNDRLRLSDPADFVRIEIEAALARDIPVIPVLTGKMTMPLEEELPPSLRPLVHRNACRVDSGPDFHQHVDRLIRGLEQLGIGPPPGLSAAVAEQQVGVTDDNLLHAIWESLDANLQDAFSLAYNKKRRQGGDRISTKDLFQALVRLQDDSVKSLLGSLPPGALPDPIDPAITAEKQLVQEESPLLSTCIADSLGHFHDLRELPRKISSADLFVDIAKHGHGESVARLRKHGVDEQGIEERVRKLGLPVLRRKAS